MINSIYFLGNNVKGLVQLKMKILSLIAHPRVVSNPWDLRSSLEHKLRYFWWNLRAFWPSIDSNVTDTFKAQKRSEDIVKIVHWCQWFNHNCMKLKEYLLADLSVLRKIHKNMNQHFFIRSVIRNACWAVNLHIGMISEGSWNTENWS